MSPLANYSGRPYRVLTADVCTLTVRQDPRYAVVTPENKEKTRRPVDPPPIVQLNVEVHHDPNREYLVNPFLFMTAALVEAEPQEHGTYAPIPGLQIIGQNVSSLHRLKDVNNKDGGFFVFGDISCRHLGTYRLQFNLFDFDKSTSQVAFVKSIISGPFKVVSQKEFKGLSESTHLSRTFSDQGVRLRLRKEPRTITGKRNYEASEPEASTSQSLNMYGGPVHEGEYAGHDRYGYETPLAKRARSSSEHPTHGSASSQFSGAGMPTYGYSCNVSGWSSQSYQGYQTDHSSYGSLASHMQPQTGPNSSYQRFLQPSSDTYSTDNFASSGNYYSNNSRPNTSLPKYQPPATYAPQPTQSYESRTSRDAYQGLPSLQATAPLPDSSLVSPHTQDYRTTTPHSATQTSALLPTHGHHHLPPDTDVRNSYHLSSTTQQPYHLHPSPDSPTDVYTHHPKYTYQPVYASDAPAPETLDTTALLTRSFAPQHGVYETGGQGYKQESAGPYPTPSQTSPLA